MTAADAAPAAPLEIVSWNLTRVCNLACGHCYLDAVQRRREAPDELSTGEAIDVIGQIAAVAPGAMVVLTGGEPLLRPDLTAIVEIAVRAGLLPVIGTNGVLLDGRRARALAGAGAAGVGVSVDSATPTFHDRLRGLPGAWVRALEGIRAARGAGLAVQIQASLFADNLDDLDALAELAEAEGALAIHFFFLVCTGRGVSQTDLSGEAYELALGRIARLQESRSGLLIRARCAPYLRRILGLRAGEERGGDTGWSGACLAGRTYLRITPDGRVTPCPYIPAAVGDLRRSDLRTIWEGTEDLARLRSGAPGGKCAGCDFRVSCGGCRARAWAATGDLMAEDPKCSYRPPAEAVPEAFACQAASGPRWSPEAQDLLERIPGFVRARVRGCLEALARRNGVDVITLDYMQAHRPRMRVPVALRPR